MKPREHDMGGALPRELQMKLNAMVEAHGVHRIAKRMGVGETTIVKLADPGGYAKRETAERIALALMGVL